ncbi:hypothetical protein ACTVNK_14260, partial [Serratia nevei]
SRGIRVAQLRIVMPPRATLRTLSAFKPSLLKSAKVDHASGVALWCGCFSVEIQGGTKKNG